MFSRWWRRVEPPYHGMLALFSTTLSPFRADTGMKTISWISSFCEKFRYSSTVRAKAASPYPTRSILLTATIRWGIRNRERIRPCLLDWVRTPSRTSMRMIAQSAREAPVNMFLVYWTWPGVSMTINFLFDVSK